MSALSLLLAVSGPLTSALDEVPAPEDVRPGWLAMGLMAVMVVVTVLLWRSMRTQIGRIDFEEADQGAAPEREATPSEGEVPPDAPRQDGRPR